MYDVYGTIRDPHAHASRRARLVATDEVNMPSSFKALLCRTIVVVLVLASYDASASMIGTEQAATSGYSPSHLLSPERARAALTTRLQSMGVDADAARERVDALSDNEARELADTLELAPAGASAGYILFALVLVLFGVWYWYRNIR
jgi:hypothetical protein